MKKEGSDLKIMEEMERKKLQDRYIRFDWAIKRCLLYTSPSPRDCS